MNLERDGNCLVAPIDNPQFPNRCIKTGAELDATTFPIAIDVIRQHKVNQSTELAGAVLGGQVGRNAVKVAAGMKNKVRFACNIALADEIQIRKRRLKRTSIVVMLFVPAVFAVVALLVALNLLTIPNDVPDIYALIAGGIAFVTLFTGVALFAISDSSVLREKRNDGQHVWLLGACPGFLDELPDYSTTAPENGG